MYSIVLIDDEPWTLEDLCNIINWADYGFTDVVSFSDPLEAAEYIKTHKPHAVCTDIRMPELSGLDLISQCLKDCPNTLFNVISAYAEFEFAQRAVKEGAFSYILKPLIEDDMRELAEKMREKISMKQSNSLKQAVRSITVGILLSSLKDPDDDAILSGSKLFSGAYRVMVSDSALEAETGGEWFRIYDDLFVGILPHAPAAYPDNILCGICSCACSPQDIRYNIQKALLAYFTLRFYGAQFGVLEYTCEDTKAFDSDCELLLSFAKEKNDLLIAEKLKEMEQSAESNMTSIQTLASFYDNILSALLSEHNQGELQENFSRFVSAFQMYSILRNYKVFFHSIQLLLNNMNTAFEDLSPDEDTTTSIVNYVDIHFAEPLTLEFLSEKFNLSLSQISRYFKKHAGCSYITYLSQKRIDRACLLLSQTNYSITDISAMVGYSDYFYFAKKFKCIMSETPSQYRRRLNNEAD